MEQQEGAMKRCLPCLAAALIALLLCLPAAAEPLPPLPEAVSALWRERWPDHSLTQYSGWGGEAAGQWALVLSRQGGHVLAIAEKERGEAAYRLTLENPSAFRPGDSQPSVLIDTGGDALFLSFREEGRLWSFSASKEGGRWGDVGAILYLDGQGEHREWLMSPSGGLVFTEEHVTDEEGNIRESYRYPPFPAPALRGATGLAGYDWQAFRDLPAWPMGEGGGPDAAAMEALAPEGWTVTGLDMNQGGLYVLGRDAQGRTRLLLRRWLHEREDFTRGAWADSLTVPLPPDSRISAQIRGWEVCLYAGDKGWGCALAHDSDRGWRLSRVMAEDRYQLGADHLRHSDSEDDTRYYGSLPWGDIGSLDLSALPARFDQALAQLDQSGWAKVNNPDPRDRLHLREAPRRDAPSLGKFYNGAPVKVLARRDGWAQVRLGGLSGWMKADYLAFGKAMNRVRPAFPERVGIESAEGRLLPLYGRPDESSPVVACRGISRSDGYWIIGLYGEEWYYVYYFDEGIGGYIRQAWFREGSR